MSRNRNALQRESLRKSLSRSESITAEACVDLDGFSRAASIRTYERRWLALLLLIMFIFGANIQWFQYTVILKAVVKFYKVSSLPVKATAWIYNASFVLLLYPLIWLMHKRGMRLVCLLASAGVCLGTWIKYFAIEPNQFSLILTGQCFVGAWQVVSASMPATLAANWFGPDETATATALGLSASIFAIALSAVVGPMIVKNQRPNADFGKDLNHYTLPLCFYTTCVLFLTFFFFTKGPKVPPSKSRALQKLCESEDFEFFKKILRLLKNPNYLLLWNAHGLIVGAMIAVNLSLDTLYKHRFQNGEHDTKKLALVFLTSAYCGSMMFARILDAFKIFKLVSIILYVAHVLSTLLLALSMYFQIRWAVYVSIAVYGFFTYAYYTTSFESCAEITYPEPVMMCVTILHLANQMYAAIFITCLDKLILVYSDIAVYAFLVVVSIVGCILTCVTRDERKRQEAGKLTQET